VVKRDLPLPVGGLPPVLRWKPSARGSATAPGGSGEAGDKPLLVGGLPRLAAGKRRGGVGFCVCGGDSSQVSAGESEGSWGRSRRRGPIGMFRFFVNGSILCSIFCWLN
jgi:hypothetical protein